MKELRIIAGVLIVLVIIASINTLFTIRVYHQLEDWNRSDEKSQKPPVVAANVAVNQRTGVSTFDNPFLGRSDAPVTIVEFCDFECPYCSKFASTTLAGLQKYLDEGKVKLIYMDMPLPFHKNAKKAAESAECAHEQGKFREMHDLIFKNQKALTVDSLKDYARKLQLDMDAFSGCLDSGSQANNVVGDIAEAKRLGVTGTPTFFINGLRLKGAQPAAAFIKIIEDELEQQS